MSAAELRAVGEVSCSRQRGHLTFTIPGLVSLSAYGAPRFGGCTCDPGSPRCAE